MKATLFTFVYWRRNMNTSWHSYAYALCLYQKCTEILVAINQLHWNCLSTQYCFLYANMNYIQVHYLHVMSFSEVANGESNFQIWRIAEIHRISSFWKPTSGAIQAWGLDEGLTTPQSKKSARYEMLHSASDLAGSCKHGNEPSVSIRGEERGGGISWPVEFQNSAATSR
jgi:hypothetical protein